MASTRDDDYHEMENHMFLRLPEAQAEELRKVIQTGAISLRDRLAIQVHADGRHGSIKFDQNCLPAILHDLPCIVESLKTVDGKTFYKCAEMCQMMVCQEPDLDTSLKDEEVSKPNKDKEKKFQHPHGLTPPLKNARWRRFRKTVKKKYIESPDIENEVKRLLRSDLEAEKIRWEVITEEDQKEEVGGNVLDADATILPLSPSSSNQIGHDDLRALFRDISSSSDTEMDGQAEDGHTTTDHGLTDPSTQPSNISSELQTPQQAVPAQIHDLDEVDFDKLQDPNEEIDAARAIDKDELYQQLEQLNSDLAEIQHQKNIQLESIKTIENMALKQRFQERLDAIMEDEMEKLKEIETIREQLDSNG